MQFPKANDTVSVQDLAQLNDALRKGSVGHQGGATMSGEDLSPLVPQSIENTLASATYTRSGEKREEKGVKPLST